MKRETKSWAVTGAVKIGHHHHQKGDNCQDAVALASVTDPAGTNWLFGIVCDGCGGVENGRNEVGATLLADFCMRELVSYTLEERGVYYSIEYLFRSIQRYIEVNLWPTRTAREIAGHIEKYWLSTILGFAMHDEFGMIFYAGDGIHVIGDSITRIEQNNQPHYLAYRCIPIPSQFGVSADLIPGYFMIDEFNPKEINRLMIATDGFENHNELKLANARKTDPELPPQLHGQQWGKKGQTGLKRWMNSRSDRGYFDDDCAIVVVERK